MNPGDKVSYRMRNRDTGEVVEVSGRVLHSITRDDGRVDWRVQWDDINRLTVEKESDLFSKKTDW